METTIKDDICVAAARMPSPARIELLTLHSMRFACAYVRICCVCRACVCNVRNTSGCCIAVAAPFHSVVQTERGGGDMTDAASVRLCCM